jgi:two-component system alkaline phosphatase synthesis response regulator PhoP
MRHEGFDGAILMLTALGQVPDRVKGLNTGADDYVVKPFDPDELLARVASLLRRVHKTVNPVARIQFGKMTVDFDAGKFLREGRALKLTNKEIELLRLLVNHRGQPLSRDYILTQVWPEQPHITERTVDVHVAWLRQKLEDVPASPRHILTVRGEGYQFER